MLLPRRAGGGTDSSHRGPQSTAAGRTNRTTTQAHSGPGSVSGAAGASGGTGGMREQWGPEQGGCGRAGRPVVSDREFRADSAALPGWDCKGTM